MTYKETYGELLKDYPFLEGENSKLLFADDIPEGWWKRFGIAFLEDLKEVLVRYDAMDAFHIIRAEEKDGELVFEAEGFPIEWAGHQAAWEYIAAHTCIECGAFPVTVREEDSHIAPRCIDHHGNEARKNYMKYLEPFIDDPLEFSPTESVRLRMDDAYSKERNRQLFEYWNAFSENVNMGPYYRKIGYEADKKQDDSKIVRMPEEDYREFCHDVKVSAMKLWERFGEPIWNDLNDNKEARSVAKLNLAYSGYVYEFFLGKDRSLDKGIELVPHYYVMPYYGMISIGWRMGYGEGYKDDYWDFYETLSLEEKADHNRRYPRPFYMDDECMFDMTEMADENEKELVSFTYRNTVTGEEKTLNVRYMIFEGLTQEEKDYQFEEKRKGMVNFLAGLKLSDMRERGLINDFSQDDLMELYRPTLDQWEFVEWKKR